MLSRVPVWVRSGGSGAITASLLVAVLFAADAQAQDTVPSHADVTGVVVDIESNQPIPGAIVELPDIGRRTITNAQGRFVLLDVPVGEQVWRSHMLGYATWEERTIVEHLDVLRIGLLPRPIELEGISVVVDRLKERRRTAGVTVVAVGREDLVRSTWSSAGELMRSRMPYITVKCPPRPVPGQSPDEPLPPHPPAGDVPWEFCIKYRGDIVRPIVFLDERRVPTEVVSSYHPAELYAIEIFAGIMGRYTSPQVRVYTTEFVRQGRRLRPLTTY